MLLNRVIERARLLAQPVRGLRRRGRARDRRTPVIVVPSILGTRLVDPRGRAIWGSTRRLYLGPPVVGASLRPGGVLDGFTVVPGLWRYDIFGGLLRFLEDAGGYRRGEDLHVLDYDWRSGVRDAAELLAARVDSLRGASERVDLIAVCSGGLVARAYLLAGAASVRRVVYVGTPQRGSFNAFVHLVEGVRPAPFGRCFPAAELARCQTCFDLLPHPDERIFLDHEGAALAHDLYDAATWVELGIAPCAPAALQPRLDAARATHRALEATPAHDAFVIGARHLPTAARALVRAGRAVMPGCEPKPGDPHAARVFEPGDSGVPMATLQALPALDPRRVFWVTPPEHRHLPSDRDVHRLTLEALLASDHLAPARE